MISKLIILALVAGAVYLVLFNKPKQHSVEQLQSWFSTKLEEIGRGLEQDIELDRQGKYPHPGRESFEPRGEITYPLVDKQYSRLELSDKHPFSKSDITATQAWQQLQARAASLGIQLRLDEVIVEGDGVDSWNELDEFIADIPRYYTVTVSGW